MLTVDRLSYRYQQQGFYFDFSLPQGELLAVQGRSGIGKSTLLELIAGFLSPVDGDIRWQGESLLPLAVEQRPVSLLFQANNLFEHLSVQQNLILGMGAVPRASLSEEIKQGTAALEVAGLLNRKPAELSGGQRQRIALLRTVLRPEPILLLDEPFTGLDQRSRQLAINWLQTTLRQSGKTTILVTHQQDDVQQLADQVLLLDDQSQSITLDQ